MSTKPRLRRIRLLVQYDGTDFCGWAEQPDMRTVQGTLKDCIRRVSDEEAEVTAASRTDSGAHAMGQVADFETMNTMPAANWADALNRRLPPDVRVVRSHVVPATFHSRFCARSRTYQYRIAEARDVEPTRARYVYECGRRLDLAPMQTAVKALTGRHDFRAFGEELEGVENTVRDVFYANVWRWWGEVRVGLEASAFIRGMVRRIAGGLYEVGAGKRSVRDFEGLLDPARRDDLQWPVVLPAKGLFLMKVKYGKIPQDVRQSKLEEDDSGVASLQSVDA